MSFNLNDYEDVQARVQRFQKTHPVGRIETHVEYFNAASGHVLIKASIFREHEDTAPAAIDYAFGDRETFRTNMQQWFVEDTVSSAIGRALALVLETSNKPTKQNMERVEQPNKFEKRVAEFIPVEKPSDPWTIEKKEMPLSLDEALTSLNDGVKPEEVPHCKHGARQPLKGVKNGKAYFGYKCQIQSKEAGQCDPIWYRQDPTGRWVPQKPAVETKEM